MIPSTLQLPVTKRIFKVSLLLGGMSSSTRLGTRISTRVNKLAARKVADRDAIQQICDQPAARKLMTWLDTVLQVRFIVSVFYNFANL